MTATLRWRTYADTAPFTSISIAMESTVENLQREIAEVLGVQQRSVNLHLAGGGVQLGTLLDGSCVVSELFPYPPFKDQDRLNVVVQGEPSHQFVFCVVSKFTFIHFQTQSVRGQRASKTERRMK